MPTTVFAFVGVECIVELPVADNLGESNTLNNGETKLTIPIRPLTMVR